MPDDEETTAWRIKAIHYIVFLNVLVSLAILVSLTLFLVDHYG